MQTLNEDNSTILLDGVNEGVLSVAFTWASPEDIDLAGMYELRDGSLGVVQALDGFGSLTEPPYVQLMNDERPSEDEPTDAHIVHTEELHINLERLDEIQRLAVMAYIYEGGHWHDVASPQMVISHPTLGEYSMDLIAPDAGLLSKAHWAKTCVLFLIERDESGRLVLRREERYILEFLPAVAKAYHFGIHFEAHSKDD